MALALALAIVIRMQIHAILSVSAVTLLEEFTYLELLLVVQEVVNDVLVILHHFQFFSRYVLEFTPSLLHFLHSYLLRYCVIR